MSTIIHPTSDLRFYRSLRLSNSLPVLLISDPSTDISSASISVRAGNFDDPPTLPGLAHFTEHMMFMGSASYPGESEYFDYVLGHGGMANGYTLAEETNFHFKVESPYLYGAMDRFASVFVQPLLRTASMQREMQAVDNEYSKNKLVEERRLYQVLATQAAWEHPMHHFSTGNLHTLNHSHSIHHHLTDFYRQHYSANVMALVVLGREPLNKLQYDVMHLFSRIPNLHLTPGKALTAASPHPYVSGVNVPSLTFVHALSVSPILNLYFPLPAYIRDHSHLPTQYMLYLLSHGGPDSLVRHWQHRGVLQYVNATMTMDSEKFSVLQYQMVLVSGVIAPDDFNDTGGVPALISEVVHSVMAYVREFRGEKEAHKRWEEWKRQLTIAWEWQEEQDPMEVTPALSKKMQTTPVRLVLDPPHLLEYDAALLDSVYAQLVPDNLMLHIASTAFPFEYERVERYYDTPFTNSTLASSLIRLWEEETVHVTLPSANPFIPTNFSLVEWDRHDLDHPVVLRSNDFYRVYYNQALQSQLPLSIVYISIVSPIIDQSPQNRAYLLLSTAMTNAAVASALFQARLIGYTAVISASPTGLLMEVEGVSSMFPAVLSCITRAVVRQTLGRREWQAVRDALIGGLAEFNQQQVYQQGLYLAALWMEEEKVSNEVLIQEMRALRYESDYEGFMRRLIDSSYVEVFGYGNVDPPAVRGYADLLMRELDEVRSTETVGRWRTQVNMTRPVTLASHFMLAIPAGDYVLCSPVLDGMSENSAAIVHYVTGEYSDVAHSVLLDMLALLINQPAFDTLRTIQQLGYIVHTQASTKAQTQRLFTILVQSGVYDAAVLSERVMSFMHDFGLELERITVKAWERARSVLLIQKKMEEDSLREKGADWWGQIQAGEEWRRKEEELEEVRQMQHTDMIDWYRERVMERGKRVRFRVEMEGKGKERSPEAETHRKGGEHWLVHSEEAMKEWKAKLRRDDSGLVVLHAAA